MKEREFAGMMYDAIRNRDVSDAVVTLCASLVTALLVSVMLTLPAAVVTWLISVLGGDAGLWLNVVSIFLKILIGVSIESIYSGGIAPQTPYWSALS